MQAHRFNLRQADESAPAPLQQFKSPQDELRWLKENRRNLQGFVRVLEILETADFFEFNQAEGGLRADWLTNHSNRCQACIGAMLCWFFGRRTRQVQIWNFELGRRRFAEHMGMGQAASSKEICAVIRRLAPAESNAWIYHPSVFGPTPWPVDYLAVFRELARKYPDK